MWVAEGLLMYLEESAVAGLFKEAAGGFCSRLLLRHHPTT